MRPLLTSIIFALLLAACRHEPAEPLHALTAAEAVMEEHPDSALSILAGVDTATTSPADRALHALLQAEALDKCGIRIASDSVVAPAVAFYDTRRQPLRAAMALYYLGRARYNAQLYASSLIAMLSAHDAAKRAGSDFWIAMTARGISENFNATYNSAEEIKYRKISYLHFKKSHHPLHELYALLDIGIAYHNNCHYDSAAMMFESLATSKHTLYHEVEEENLHQLMRTQYAAKQYSDAVATAYRLHDKYALNPEDSVITGLALADAGRIQEAAKWIPALTSATGINDLLYYRYYALLGDSARALLHLEKTQHAASSLFSEATTNNICQTIIDHSNTLQALKDAELEASGQKLKLLFIIFILLVASLILYIIIYRKRKQDKINSALNIAQELSASIHSKQADFITVQASVQKLMQEQMEVFDNYCKAYYESRNNEISAQRLKSLVYRTIESVQDCTEEYERLEQYANQLHDGIIANFKKDLPDLKQADYSLFLFCLFGLSNSSICALLKEEKADNVYNRKRRLKNKINKLDTERRDLYLSFL